MSDENNQRFLKECSFGTFDSLREALFLVSLVEDPSNTIEMNLVEVSEYRNQQIPGIDRVPFSLLLKAKEGQEIACASGTFRVCNDSLGEFTVFGQNIIVPDPATGPSVMLEINFG